VVAATGVGLVAEVGIGSALFAGSSLLSAASFTQTHSAEDALGAVPLAGLLKDVGIAGRLAGKLVPGAAKGFSPLIEVGGTRFVYGEKVLARMSADAYHDFPTLLDKTILTGQRTVNAESGYIQYTARGSITIRGSVQGGTFEIGTFESAFARGERIVHRFFRPDQ
jgi:hypothetical protein